MILSRTCSWCHTCNVLEPGRPTFCQCGHRGDLPRMCCTCHQCIGPICPDDLPVRRLADEAIDLATGNITDL